MESKQPLHYHMFAGEIFFRHKDTEETLTTRMNAMTSDEDQKLPVRLLEKAQRGLQLAFFQAMGEDAPKCTVINCVILSSTYLGQFTAEEFHAGSVSGQAQETAPAEQIPSEKKLSVMPKPVSLEEAVAEAQKQ